MAANGAASKSLPVIPRLPLTGYAAGRSEQVLVFFPLDDDVMSLGLPETRTVEREPCRTLRPSARFRDETDDATLVAGLARTAFS